MSPATPNEEQVKYWNEVAGPRWVALQEQSDAQLRPLGIRVMDETGIGAGERVADVGAGCGDTTLELARRVGPTGHVHAVDISAAMLDRARARVLSMGHDNTSFQLGDVQAVPLDRAPHDVVFSRFGVMFFDKPTVAFSRLREAVREGGRLGFCCWRSRAENQWLAGGLAIAARFIELPAPPPDPHAPGPFGLFDRERTLGVLRAAGWRDVTVEPNDQAMVIGGGGGLEQSLDFLVRLGPVAAALPAAAPEVQARLLDALREFLAPHLRAEGVVMTGATWIVTARR